jgi:hypothetical protein
MSIIMSVVMLILDEYPGARANMVAVMELFQVEQLPVSRGSGARRPIEPRWPEPEALAVSSVRAGERVGRHREVKKEQPEVRPGAERFEGRFGPEGVRILVAPADGLPQPSPRGPLSSGRTRPMRAFEPIKKPFPRELPV